MKIRKIMALMLLSGCLIMGTNIAYADCKDTRTIEWEIPVDGHFDFTDLRKIEGNENKTDEELSNLLFSNMTKYVKEKLTPDLYADEDLGTIELDGANLFKVLSPPTCERQDTPYSISDEIKNKTFELAKSKIEGLSDWDKPYSAYYDSERKAYYCAFTKKVNIPINNFYGKTITVKTEKNYNVYIKEKKDQIFIDGKRLNDYLSENPNADVNKEYLQILYNVLKEQEGDKIKNIEEYTEDTGFHKEGNRAYVYGYVTNNDGEKILTKIWMDLLDYIPDDNDFSITINEIEHGLKEETVNKINNILKKYNENIFYVGGYKLDSNIFKYDQYYKQYYICLEKCEENLCHYSYRFNFKLQPDFTFDSILKNFDLDSEKYSKYKDFNNLMIKKYSCELKKIKEYISSSDGKENINSYVKNKDESFTLLKTDILNEYAKDYIILESKNGKKYLVKINNLIVPAVKLYENPLDKEETITEEDKHNIDKVFRHYFKDLYKSTEFVSDKVRIDPCGRAYLKVKIFFNDNVFNELETEIRVNRTFSDLETVCPPAFINNYNDGTTYRQCQKEGDCSITNRYRFGILDPNIFSENVECTPEKPDVPDKPDEQENPIIPNVPNNPTPATPSNIPSNNSTPREKTNTTVVPKQNDEKTPITIVNSEEKVITENDFQEGKNSNLLIKRDIKTGDNLFTITILMLFGILGLGGNWFCNKLYKVKKRE